MLTVNAPRSTIEACEWVSLLNDIAIQGGLDEASPPHAAVIRLAFPDLSYVPTTITGVGRSNVFAPVNDFFILHRLYEIE
jgi:hypothetical protein